MSSELDSTMTTRLRDDKYELLIDSISKAYKRQKATTEELLKVKALIQMYVKPDDVIDKAAVVEKALNAADELTMSIMHVSNMSRDIL